MLGQLGNLSMTATRQQDEERNLYTLQTSRTTDSQAAIYILNVQYNIMYNARPTRKSESCS